MTGSKVYRSRVAAFPALLVVGQIGAILPAAGSAVKHPAVLKGPGPYGHPLAHMAVRAGVTVAGIELPTGGMSAS